MEARRRQRSRPDQAPATDRGTLADAVTALGRATERLERLLYGHGIAQADRKLYSVVDNGQVLPAAGAADVDVWRRAPANVLLDLLRYELWLCLPGSPESRRITLGSGHHNSPKLGGPALDFLQALAENPGLRLTPTVTGELTGKVIGAAHARQLKRRLCARLGLEPDEMIRTEQSVSASLPDSGPVYYADPGCTWRVIRYADWLSRKKPFHRSPDTAA